MAAGPHECNDRQAEESKDRVSPTVRRNQVGTAPARRAPRQEGHREDDADDHGDIDHSEDAATAVHLHHPMAT
jgi:hypothetical protein